MLPKMWYFDTMEKANKKPMSFRCRDCRAFFSIRHGSVMERSYIPLRKWAIAIYLNATRLKGVSSMKLHRDLGITQKSAWFMAHRLKAAFASATGLFAGPVEADETYLGGKRKNMPKAKGKGMTGRGPVGRTTVVGVKDRDSNKVTARTVERTDAPTLQGFVADNTAGGPKVYTDEASAYAGLPKHEAVNHSAGEYVRGMAHTNGMESFWSMLKRGYHGTFHHFSEKHTDRYVAEFAGRHNIREQGTLDQMKSIVAGMVGKRLPYRTLIAE